MIIKILESKNKGRGNRVLCKCDNCSNILERKYSDVIKSNKKNHFCNKHCQSEYFSNGNACGNLNHNWQGGITKHIKGYIYVYCPNHPSNPKNGYVLEHRLVMEKKLGRYLTKDEIVHHNNGIKDDNREENLSLFCNASSHTIFERSLQKQNYLQGCQSS